MATDLVHDPTRPFVPPVGVTLDADPGFDTSSILTRITTPLPYESGYTGRKWRAFRTLTGAFTFTFPASPLDAPVGWTQHPATLFLFVAGRAAVLDRVTTPEAATIRELYGVPHPARPKVRAATITTPFPAGGGLTITITFAGVRVAGVRATYHAVL